MGISVQVLELVNVKINKSDNPWFIVVLHANGCNRFAGSGGALEFCNITDFPRITVYGDPIAVLPILHALKRDIGHVINHFACLLVNS